MTKEKCKKTVDTNPSALMHVSNCYKSRKTCEKVVDIYLFMLGCAPNCYKTQ